VGKSASVILLFYHNATIVYYSTLLNSENTCIVRQKIETI